MNIKTIVSLVFSAALILPSASWAKSAVNVEIQSDDATIEYDLTAKIIPLINGMDKFQVATEGKIDVYIKLAVASVKDDKNTIYGAAIATLSIFSSETGKKIITFDNEFVLLEKLENKVKSKIRAVLEKIE